ncbi:MAG: glutathione S-transferase family protein [Deltaproteobacteria bacterium]|nr:glutathione S-transferase family protein [Deltaproteobacteria bacterium]
MKLYSDPRQPNVRRVLMFILEKGIDVPIQEMSLQNGEHKTEEFRAKNPLGQVPLLELTDGTYVSESVSICRYLEECYPEKPLFGTTPAERAHIDMWQRRMELRVFIPAVEYGHHTHPFFAPRIKQFPDWGASNREVIEATYDWLEQELRSRPFIYGESFTIADITGFNGVQLAEVWGIGIQNRGNLAKWRDGINARESARVVRYAPRAS